MATKVLLLVEDSQDDIDLTTRALRKSGVDMSIDYARDGVEALAYLRERALPAVILLDLKLPRLTGLEVLERLRADPEKSSVPVVVLSSSSHPQDLISSYRLGCNSYLQKPVDSARFQEVIRTIGRYWIEMNESPVGG